MMVAAGAVVLVLLEKTRVRFLSPPKLVTSILKTQLKYVYLFSMFVFFSLTFVNGLSHIEIIRFMISATFRLMISRRNLGSAGEVVEEEELQLEDSELQEVVDQLREIQLATIKKENSEPNVFVKMKRVRYIRFCNNRCLSAIEEKR